MKSVAVIAIATVLLLTGCRKEPSHPESNQVAGVAVMNTFSYNPADNSANPWDSIGKLHNQVLDSLRKYVKRNNDTTYVGRGNYLRYYAETYRNYRYNPVRNFTLEQNVCTDYKTILFHSSLSPQAKSILIRLNNVLEQIQNTDDFPAYAQHIKEIEKDISDASISNREQSYLFIVSSVLRHSGYYWMDQFEKGYVTQKKGILGFLRKVAGVITGIAADATTAGYHYLKGSPIDHLVIETAWMSEICGYYTGWY